MSSECNCITHVIFDFDGLICNTIEYFSYSLEKACSSIGLKIPDHIKVAEFGSFQQLDHLLTEAFNCKCSYQIMEEFKREFFNYGTDCFQLLPGIKNLTSNLHKSGIHIAIATGGSSGHFNRVTEKFGDLFKPGVCFEHIVFGEEDIEVERMKPDPDLLQLAASRFKVAPKRPNNVLVFDDSIVGMKAAKEANMIGVWVVDQRFHTINEKEKKYAHSMINSMLEFDSKVFGLEF